VDFSSVFLIYYNTIKKRTPAKNFGKENIIIEMDKKKGTALNILSV
jgi:hypothetical protein